MVRDHVVTSERSLAGGPSGQAASGFLDSMGKRTLELGKESLHLFPRVRRVAGVVHDRVGTGRLLFHGHLRLFARLHLLYLPTALRGDAL